MTNRERYKQAFSALQTSGKISLEVEDMVKMQKKHRKNIAVAAAAICAALIGVSGTAYAADIGGIQEKVSIWINGKEEEVVITGKGDGSYTLHFESGDDNQVIGGVAIGKDENGDTTEHMLSPNDIVVTINQSADIVEDANGHVWIYYYDQKADITDLFDEEGACKVQLTHEGQTVYLEIERDKDGAFAHSQSNDLPEDSEDYIPVVTERVGEEENGFQPHSEAGGSAEAEKAKSADISAAE